METQHKNLTQEKWFTMSLAEQLGNVGSEYGRARNWREKHNEDYANKAIDRMLELLDLTISDKRWHNHRLKELTRLREVACEEFFSKSGHKEQYSLSNYFHQFAMLARIGR